MTHPTTLTPDWQSLLPRVTELARTAGALRTITRHLSAEAGYEALSAIQRDLDRLDTLNLGEGSLLDEARAAAEPVRAWLADEWERRAAEVTGELRAWFADREVDLTGDGPELRAGALTLTVDAARDRVDLFHAGEPLNAKKIPLAPDRVFRAWRSALDALERRATPPLLLGPQLEQAYRQVCLLKDLAPGSRTRLSDVHFQLFVLRQTSKVKQDPRKGRLKEYPRYQFAWDLGAALVGNAVPGTGLVVLPASESAARSRSTSVIVERDGASVAYADLQG